MTRPIDLDVDATNAIAALAPANQPVLMINLLRFRERADYGDYAKFAPCSGREAYFQRYAAVSSPLVGACGGKIHWMGSIVGNLIAPPDEIWDDILLVEYPTFSSLQGLFANPQYQAALVHRTAALEDARQMASVLASPDSAI